MSEREFEGSPFVQGAEEEIGYEIDVSEWGDTPSNVTVKIYEWPGGTDKSATLLDGSATISGNIIYLPQIIGLTAEMMYRLEVKFTLADLNIYECFGYIAAER